MGTLINTSIDVTKINKAKLVNGKYLNITISVNDKVDNYGNNVSITESQTKEEREAKASKNYLGNGKVVYTSGQVEVAPKKEQTTFNNATKEAPDDDLPF